jgi:hypothetical protein
MILKSKGLTMTQTSHVNLVLGVSNAPNVTRIDSSVRSDFVSWYNLPATVIVGPLSMATIRSKIMSNKPIYAGVTWSPLVGGGGHAVVIVSCDNTNDTLRIFDPSPNSLGEYIYSRSDFLTSYLDWGVWDGTVYLN